MTPVRTHTIQEILGHLSKIDLAPRSRKHSQWRVYRQNRAGTAHWSLSAWKSR